MLMVFDDTNENCTVLSLNRDTIVEMPVLGLGGKPAGTTTAQLALAHTYGNGLESSCENTMNTVSGMLGGIRIDHYVSMNLDALAILNDAVGGVTVNNTADFSAVDATIPMGEVTLHGEQALTYVRSRYSVGDQLNITRMGRQQEYMTGWLAAFQEKIETDTEFLTQAYEDVDEYIVTDCSMQVLMDMIDDYADYTLKEMVTPEGENIKGEKYYEFHVDEEKLDAMVLELFYAEK